MQLRQDINGRPCRSGLQGDRGRPSMIMMLATSGYDFIVFLPRPVRDRRSENVPSSYVPSRRKVVVGLPRSCGVPAVRWTFPSSSLRRH